MYKNPVLELFVEIKTAYINENGSEQLFSYGNDTNCLAYWTSHISDNKKYQAILSYLEINEHNGFVVIHYSDLGVDFDAYDGLFRECRSITIDVKNDAIALLPFAKFFNVNEREDTQINLVKQMIDSAKFVEFSTKLDGSFIAMRWYNGKLILASSHNLDKNKSVIVEQAYHYLNDGILKLVQDNPATTFMFELIGDNRIVVAYDKANYGLYLWGMRDSVTGYEYSYETTLDYAEKYDVKSTNLLNSNFEDILAQVHNEDFDPTLGEGFVINVCDNDNVNHRYKIKYDSYVLLHCIIGKATATNNIIQAIRNGSSDDLISYIPDAFRDRTIEIVNNVKLYVSLKETEVKHYYDAVVAKCGNCDNKIFALAAREVVPAEYFGKVMNLKNGKKNDYLIGVKYYNIVAYLQEH